VANLKQAAKRARQAEHSRQRNASQRSMTRTYIKKVRVAIEAGDKEQAADTYKVAQSCMDRAGRKGIMHRNAIARQKSRLNAMIKAMT
jgi:small subunit ribosomal protein S20